MAGLDPVFSRQTLLIAANGYYVRVTDKDVDGVDDSEDKNAVLSMQSISMGEIAILGEQSNKYISMNSQGKVVTTPSLSCECIFKETQLISGYNTYESKANPGLYLGITKSGNTKNGYKTRPDQKAVLFLTGDVKREIQNKIFQ